MNKSLNDGKSMVKIMRKTTGFAKKFDMRSKPAPGQYRVQESLWMLNNKRI